MRIPSPAAGVLIALTAGGLACADAKADHATAPPPRARATGTAAAPIAPPIVTAGRSLGRADATGEIVRAFVVSRVGADGVADDRPKRARRDQGVTLFAVAEVKDGARRTYVSDAGEIVVGGKRVTTRAWADAPVARIAWFKIEPAVASMSNTESGEFRFEAIDYRATELPADAGATSLPADVHPTLTPDHGDGVGTMRYQLVVTVGDRAIASAGVDARRGRGSGGLTDAVHRVSLRRDDTYLGYLTEMYGQPYIWASAGSTAASHQSERLEGADCADFVVYGARRMGLSVGYTWTEGLPSVTRTLGHGAPDDDGVYRDDQGQPLPFPKVGDLVLFPRHVGVLVADRGQPGVLDEQDVIMHALFDTPKEVAIADSGYGGLPIKLLRWPKR